MNAMELREKSQKEAMDELGNKLTELLEYINVDTSDFTMENSDPDLPMLLWHDWCCYWEDGAWCVDEAVDTSDPSVGIIGAWEPKCWIEKQGKPRFRLYNALIAAETLARRVLMDGIDQFLDACWDEED